MARSYGYGRAADRLSITAIIATGLLTSVTVGVVVQWTVYHEVVELLIRRSKWSHYGTGWNPFRIK